MLKILVGRFWLHVASIFVIILSLIITLDQAASAQVGQRLEIPSSLFGTLYLNGHVEFPPSLIPVVIEKLH